MFQVHCAIQIAFLKIQTAMLRNNSCLSGSASPVSTYKQQQIASSAEKICASPNDLMNLSNLGMRYESRTKTAFSFLQSQKGVATHPLRREHYGRSPFCLGGFDNSLFHILSISIFQTCIPWPCSIRDIVYGSNFLCS